MSDCRGIWQVALLIGMAFILSGGTIGLAWPWLKHFALARPNPRSSHAKATPQAGGIAVVGTTLLASWGAIALCSVGTASLGQQSELLLLTAAVVLLAAVGAIDDMRSLSLAPRLILQCIAAGIVIAAMPHDMRIASFLPWWAERLGIFVAVLWLINLTNFMDGLDWMTVAEIVPITSALVLLAVLGQVDARTAVVAAALLGAMLGFAPYNRPVARLFLGDVGSLPTGLLLAWLLLKLAADAHHAAALILPLYYLADATLTLARRTLRGEPFWQAHRSHFYQRATDRGFSVGEIVARVFGVNAALAGLACITVLWPRSIVVSGAIIMASASVAWLLWSFVEGKAPSPSPGH